MRRLALWAVLAAGLAACSGPTTSGEDAGGSDASVDCAGASDGTACGAGRVCSGGACVAGSCGDSVVDRAAGEECDDGNEAAFDGCTECRFDCTANSQCDDGDPCNGEERCDIDTHGCASGTAEPEGTPCTSMTVPDGVCRDMSPRPQCVAVGCGNGVPDGVEQCDDGANGDPDDGCRDDCTFSCETSADCDDANVCNGSETCDLATHRCRAGTTLDCDDADDCTADACEAATGCTNALIDADSDGFAPMTAGECGTDCNDSNDTVNPDATEICDTVDNDCDGMTDETAPFWYVDCDRDGFAPSTDGAVQQCAMPIGAPTVCTGPGTWTSLEPTDSTTTDCLDARLEARPGAIEACNRVDDDCDAFVDEDQLIFTRATASGTRPSLDSPPIVAYNPVARQFAGLDVVEGSGGFSGGDDELFISRIADDGTLIGRTSVATTSASFSDLQITVVDGEYVVAWTSSSSSISFARVDAFSGVASSTGSLSTSFPSPSAGNFAMAATGPAELGIVWGNGTSIAATRVSLTTRNEVTGARITDFSGGTPMTDDSFEVVATNTGMAVFWRTRTGTSTYDLMFRTLGPAGAGTAVRIDDYADYELTYDEALDQIVMVLAVRVGTTAVYTIRLRTIDPATGIATALLDAGTTYSTSGVPRVTPAWAGEPGQIGLIANPNDGDPRRQLRRLRVSDGALVPTTLRVDSGYEALFLPSESGTHRFFAVRAPTGAFDVGRASCLP